MSKEEGLSSFTEQEYEHSYLEQLTPIMPQQQLLAQKDALQAVVKNAWENCLDALDAKFPDLAEPNPGDESVISVKLDLERPTRTDDNILFIKETVQNVIATTPLSSLIFDKQAKAMQEQMLRRMLERMIAKTLIEALLQDPGEPLAWCECTAEYKRITLALLLVNEIREKFPNKNKRLVYTSFASGSLLQDYVILSELLLSHTNFLVNLIDLEYPDIPALAKKDLRAKVPGNLHKLEMKNKQESADMIDSFKVKIAQAISEKRSVSENYKFNVNIYQNAYEYIARVQKNTGEKSNVLLIVDPSVWTFGIEDFPSLANVINVWIDSQINKPAFTIYLPRHQGAHLYQIQESDNPETIEYLKNQLTQLITSTGADKKYTPNLVKELLDKAITFDEPLKKTFLTANFPQLMEIKKGLKREALEYGDITESLLQSLTPVQLGDVRVLLSWGTDAHISFQDLVWSALAPNAIIYQLYAVDPLETGDTNNRIIKVNPETYKKTDVITPNAGRASDLMAPGYKQISPFN